MVTLAEDALIETNQRTGWSAGSNLSQLSLRSQIASCAVLFLAAFAVRLAYAMAAGGLSYAPLYEDEWSQIGLNLRHGLGFSLNGTLPTAMRLPAYPALLGALFAVFGPIWPVVRGANILLSAAIAPVTWLIACRVFDRRVAMIAGWLAVFHLPFIFNAATLMADTAYALACAMVLFVAGRGTDEVSYRRIGSMGALIGLTALIRGEILLFVPFVAAWLAWPIRSPRDLIARWAALVLPIVLLVSPWIARNYIQFDRVMLTTTGHVLWGIYNPTMFRDKEKMGGWYFQSLEIRNANAVTPEHRDPSIMYLPEPQWDRELVKRSFASLRQYRSQLWRMTVYKCHSLLLDVGPIGSLTRLPLLYLFIFGLACLAARGMLGQVAYLAYLLASTAIVAVLLYTNTRLRMSADVPFLIVAAYGAREQWIHVKALHMSPTTGASASVPRQ